MRQKPRKSVVIERVETVAEYLRRGGQITRVTNGISRHMTDENTIIARMLGASQEDVLDDDQRSAFGASVRDAIGDRDRASASMTGFDDVIDAMPELPEPIFFQQ